MFLRAHLALPLLFLPALTRLAAAQPPDVPSTINAPATPTLRAPVAPPDPLLITPETLQFLLGGATTVTLSAQNAPLEEVLQTLLSGTNIQPSRTLQGLEKQTLSVNWQAKPFWSAAAEVETLTGKVWDGRYSDGLALTRGDSLEAGFGGLVGVQGPLLTLVAQGISRSSHRSQGLGAKATLRPARDYVQISLTAYFDPKLSVQTTEMRALRFQVKGEAPRLGAENRFGFGNAVNGATRAALPLLPLTLPLPADTAPGTRFERISGVLHCVVVARTEPFSVPDVLATPQTSKKEGLAQHDLLSASVAGSQLTLRLSAATDEVRPARPFSPAPNFFSTLRVRDGAGHELPRSGTSSTGTRSEGNFRFRIKTPAGELIPGPYSLEWPFITEVRSLDVPFELRDVVVP